MRTSSPESGFGRFIVGVRRLQGRVLLQLVLGGDEIAARLKAFELQTREFSPGSRLQVPLDLLQPLSLSSSDASTELVNSTSRSSPHTVSKLRI